MNVKQTIYERIKNGTFALNTDEEIARKLRLDRKQANLLREVLSELCREGKLYCDYHFRYGTAEQFRLVKGKISGNERGFGFFVAEEAGVPDLFIPHKLLKGAYHGDTVLACKSLSARSEDEGEVMQILQRGYREIVGTFYMDRKAGYLRPDEKKFCEDIYIPFSKIHGAKTGDKAVALITSYPDGRAPGGEIIEVLGDGEDFFVEELSLIRAHKLREEFPEEVEAAAEKQAARPITEEDLKDRLDLRDELIITIDGEDTRDIDDAISISFQEGVYRLGVHIADVSHYVAFGSELDGEAYVRGTSVYFPDRVLPMLPKALSNGICSLNEGVDRLALSCLMTVDASGKVTDKQIRKSVIRSAHRMTYTDVTAIAERKAYAVEKYPDLVGFVDDAVALTKILQAMRDKKGCVSMDVKEAKILYVNEEIVIPDYERTISHEMIEQFMVLANECVATLMSEKKLPFVYRIHEKPAPEKAKGLEEFLIELGVSPKFDPENVSPADYRDLLYRLKDSPVYPIVNRVMLRSMMKARYSPVNAGHFGLASDCYCHFTSPIRRYPDLCIHRVIKEAMISPELAEKKYRSFTEEASVRSSDCERNATEAERDVDALYMVAYMQDKIGEEYDATISGMTNYCLFAELKNTLEGCIPIDTLPEDSYDYVEEKFLLRGTKRAFRIGDSVRVRVVGVDWAARRTIFVLV